MTGGATRGGSFWGFRAFFLVFSVLCFHVFCLGFGCFFKFQGFVGFWGYRLCFCFLRERGFVVFSVLRTHDVVLFWAGCWRCFGFSLGFTIYSVRVFQVSGF